MSDLTWASNALQEHVAPKGTAQYVKERIDAARRALGWKYSRTRDIWYVDVRVSVKPREIRDIENYTGLRYGRHELSEVDALIGKADALDALGQDEDFVGPFVAAIRAMVGAYHRARVGKRGGEE